MLQYSIWCSHPPDVHVYYFRIHQMRGRGVVEEEKWTCYSFKFFRYLCKHWITFLHLTYACVVQYLIYVCFLLLRTINQTFVILDNHHKNKLYQTLVIYSRLEPNKKVWLKTFNLKIYILVLNSNNDTTISYLISSFSFLWHILGWHQLNIPISSYCL